MCFRRSLPPFSAARYIIPKLSTKVNSFSYFNFIFFRGYGMDHFQPLKTPLPVNFFYSKTTGNGIFANASVTVN